MGFYEQQLAKGVFTQKQYEFLTKHFPHSGGASGVPAPTPQATGISYQHYVSLTPEARKRYYVVGEIPSGATAPTSPGQAGATPTEQTTYYVYVNPRGATHFYTSKPKDWNRLVGQKSVYNVGMPVGAGQAEKGLVQSAIRDEMAGKGSASEILGDRLTQIRSKQQFPFKWQKGVPIKEQIKKLGTAELKYVAGLGGTAGYHARKLLDARKQTTAISATISLPSAETTQLISSYRPSDQETARDVMPTPKDVVYKQKSVYGEAYTPEDIEKMQKQYESEIFIKETDVSPTLIPGVGIGQTFNLDKSIKDAMYPVMATGGKMLKGVGIETTALGSTFITSTVAGFVSAPITTGEFAVRATTQPVETATGVWEQVQTPEGQMEFLGGSLGTMAFFKTFKPQLPAKVTYRSFKYPGIGGKMEAGWRGLSFEVNQAIKNYAKPLVGVGEGKVQLGTPGVNLLKADLAKGMIWETATDVPILLKNLKGVVKDTEIVKFQKGVGVMQKTATTPSKFIQKEFQKEAKAFARPEKSVPIVLDIARQYKGTVYGSFPTKAQVPSTPYVVKGLYKTLPKAEMGDALGYFQAYKKGMGEVVLQRGLKGQERLSIMRHEFTHFFDPLARKTELELKLRYRLGLDKQPIKDIIKIESRGFEMGEAQMLDVWKTSMKEMGYKPHEFALEAKAQIAQKGFVWKDLTKTEIELTGMIDPVRIKTRVPGGRLIEVRKYPEFRTPADIDIQFMVSQAQAEAIAQVAVKRLRGVGEKARVAPGRGSLVEVMGKDKKWHHAIDIHSIEDMMSDSMRSSVAGSKVYGLPLQQKTFPIEGVKVMPLSEQGLRKGASIFTLRQVDDVVKFAPEAHRIKDIGDFFATQEVLIKSKMFGKTKAMAELRELKQMYKESELTVGTQKIELYSPVKGKTSPTAPMIDLGTPVGKPRKVSEVAEIQKISKSRASVSRTRISPSSASYSISKSISKSMSASISKSASKSVSPSKSISPSPSKSISKSISKSLSPSISPPKSPSISPSVSPSISPSVSPSVSPSPSPSVSPSPPYRPPSVFVPSVSGKPRGKKAKKKKDDFDFKVYYKPSVIGVESGKVVSKRLKKVTGLGVRYPVKVKTPKIKIF